MSGHRSVVLGQWDDAVVQGWLSGELDVQENPDIALRLIERMWTELEGWHRIANDLAARNLGPMICHNPDRLFVTTSSCHSESDLVVERKAHL